MRKPAETAHPIHELLRERWSPRAFDDRPVERAALLSLFEAARWAPSSFNEQPWRFVFAGRHDRPEAFERLLTCLTESNRAWARLAPIVGFSVAKLAFDRNARPNRHAFHDVGLAMGGLLVEATSRGIAVHQMAGFDAEKARGACGLPEGYDPVAGFALGYPGNLDRLDERNRARETEPRRRIPVETFAFVERWGNPLTAPPY